MEIALAIILGTLFGFVLQRVGAADPDRIVGMIRLTDLHLAKTILLAIGSSSALLFLSLAAGWTDVEHLSVKTMSCGVLVGGLVFGAGWAVSGYCPGTGVAAAGAGRKDAVAFVLGGLCGAALFMLSYGSLGRPLMELELLGGNTTVAVTGGPAAMLSGLPGWLPALSLAGILVGLAACLPESLRRKRDFSRKVS